MNKLRLFVTLFALLGLAAGFTFAHDGEVKHRLKFKIDGDGEAIVIDDLEVGETRQFFTDSGKEVIVTREEDGVHLTVDGEEIDIPRMHGHHGAHHGASVIDVEGDGDTKAKVIIKKIIKGDGHEDGEHVMVWHGDDGEMHEMHGEHGFAFVMKRDVAEHVVESGVLDDLDSAKREEILRVIREADTSVIHHRQKVMVDDEDDD